MLVALRRFRTTLATVILRMARRADRGTGSALAVAGVAIACGLARPAAAEPAASRLLAAGEAAAERGWFAAARDHWHDAARLAATTGDTVTRDRVAARTARLDTVIQEARRAAADRAQENAAAWDAADWPVSWRSSAAAAECGADGAPAAVAVADGLVLWNTGRAVHALTLSEGRPAWRTGNGRDTCVFPRGIAGGLAAPVPACTLRPEAASCAGHLAYAVIDRGGDGQALVCLDLSDAAEGRLAWSAAPPDAANGMAAFDGPPTADHELCAVVLRADDARGSLALAVFDAKDGSVRWVRSLGAAVAVDGVDAAGGRRQPCLAEDRIVIATHAGTLCAFDRDGGPAWNMPLPPPAVGPGPTPSTAPARVAGERLLVASGDGRGIMAIDPRRGGLLWHWRLDDGSIEAVLGGCSDGLVIATRDDAAATTLRRLSLADGLQTAVRRLGNHRSAGSGTTAHGLVFWPSSPGESAEDSLDIEVLDAATLERRREPVSCEPAPSRRRSSAVRLMVAHGSLLIADDSLTCRRPAPAPRTPAAPAISSQ